jgi:hypothetical protein
MKKKEKIIPKSRADCSLLPFSKLLSAADTLSYFFLIKSRPNRLQGRNQEWLNAFFSSILFKKVSKTLQYDASPRSLKMLKQ